MTKWNDGLFPADRSFEQRYIEKRLMKRFPHFNFRLTPTDAGWLITARKQATQCIICVAGYPSYDELLQRGSVGVLNIFYGGARCVPT